MGGDVQGYIPNRFDEGYGLNTDALENLHSQGVDLVITVDCGIRSPKEVEYAHNLGLDMIISDHHHPGPQMPQAIAIINPKQAGDAYSEKDLAGVGLAYKLACALLETYAADSSVPPAESYLDLVALGTVADIVPLTGENRTLVRTGLERIRSSHRPGILSLIGVARLSPQKLNAEHIGFMLGPRLNAAGRLDSALAALNLLCTSDVAEAARIAQSLDDQNRERQQITRQIQADAEQRALAEDPEAFLLFAADASYNSGVVGLAASRLAEQYYRPSIVAHQGDEYTRGSCRSIPEFHITQALDQTANLLVQHGGHAAAAGFTVRNEDLSEFVSKLKEIARQELSELDLRPTLNADMEVHLSELRPELLNDLAWLQPTGQSNPPATFVTRHLKVLRSRTVGKEKNHLKLTVADDQRLTFEAIAFRQGHWQAKMPPRVDILYHFELNEFNGRKTLQLNVRDLKPSHAIG
jgi:single-stranded-DNA-specific exonuclease